MSVKKEIKVQPRAWAKDFLESYPKSPCMHDNCSQCHGTGKKDNGEICVHMISCPCPKCSPRC
jgi:hypothetical protein